MYFDARLWAMTAGCRGRLLFAAVFGLCGLAAGMARVVLLGHFFALIFAGAFGRPLIFTACGVVVAILARGAFEHATNQVTSVTAMRIQAALRERLFDHIVELGPGWFGQARTGGVMLTVIDGVEQLQSFFGRYLPQLFISVCAPWIIFAFIAWQDLPVASVLLIAALATLTLPLLSHASNRAASQGRQRAFKAFGERFLDAVQGLPTLKALGQSGAMAGRLAADARALSDNTFRVLGREVSTRFVTDAGITLGASLALTLGAWRVAHGSMTLSALLVVLMAGTEVFRPLRDLRSVLHQGMVGQSAAAGVFALLDAEGPARAQPRQTDAPAARLDPGPLAIRFDGVSFSYPGSRRQTHAALGFEVRPGERVAIVGPSGSGKSTLVRLLLGLETPQHGAIEIGGIDMQRLDVDAIRSRIAVVAQDSTIFHGTVEDNIRLGMPGASAERVRDAARAANAHDFIEAMPQGYRTMVGERGIRLSGGQRQRIAIARALLRDASILVLDEALSSVDAENEASIQRELDRLAAGRTTLVLAHRLSSVIGADRIFVLDHGAIVESGHHEALLARRGTYWRLMGGQAEEAAFAEPWAHAAPAQSAAAAGGFAAEADDARADVVSLDTDASAITLRAAFAMLLAVVAPLRAAFAWMVAAGVARVAAFIGVPLLSALVVARLKVDAAPGGLIPSLLVTALLAAALHWYESWKAHAIAYRLLAEMRIALFAKLEALAPAYLQRRRAGDLVALAAQDVETVEYFFAHTVAPAAVAVLVPAVVLIALGLSAWPLALALLPFLVLAGASPMASRRKIDRLGVRARGALGSLSAHLTESIQGMAELLAYSAIPARRAAFAELLRRYQADRLELLRDLSLQGVLLDVLTGLGGLAVGAAGAWLCASGVLDARLLPMLALLAVSAFLPVSEISQVGRQLADTLASARRLKAVHDEPVRVADGPVDALPDAGGVAVHFDRVDFTYPGEPGKALRNLTLDIPPCTTVALVGASGAGKSTIASLLMRFWDPDSGVVALNGVGLPSLTLRALHAQVALVALVAQDTWLMNASLEANIRLAKPDASHDELREAIRRAALAEFVGALPDGLDTLVGERGVSLSGGQRQRIAIARAFLRDAPVLVLDEATSHLDAISEARVHAALLELMRDRTVLIIAHRLSTIRHADRIAVVDAGQVIEQGTHASLLGRNGTYARLVARQLGAARAA